MLRMPRADAPKHLGLKARARPVAGGDLHHRFEPVLQGEERARQRRHARRGGGVIGKIGRVHPGLEQRDLAQHVGRVGSQRRSDLGGEHELPFAQLALQPRNGVVLGCGVGQGIAAPPIRLADLVEEALPGSAAHLGGGAQPLERAFDPAHLLPLVEHVLPGLRAHLVPIQRGQHLHQAFDAPHLLGALVDLVPHAGAGLIHIAVFGGRSAAGSVAQTLGALHGADESRLLQQAVAAHAAAEERAFDGDLERFEHALGGGFVSKGVVSRLPAPDGCKTRHGRSFGGKMRQLYRLTHSP